MIAIPYKDDSSMYTASLANNLVAPRASLEAARESQALYSAQDVTKLTNPNFFGFTK